jgi:hypothetical protein
MNLKQAKKLRKEARRRIDEVIGTGAEAFGKLARKRPKHFPKFIWILLYVPLFKFKHLKTVYKYI